MERAKLFAKTPRTKRSQAANIFFIFASSWKTSSCHFLCRISKKQPSILSLAWDSRALSPHMTLAVCTRLPNAYDATPANGAICGKSLFSNLSVSFSLSSLCLPLSSSPPLLSSFLRSHSRHSARTFRTICVATFPLCPSIILSANFRYSKVIQFVTFT